jgi:hypothetical protein
MGERRDGWRRQCASGEWRGGAVCGYIEASREGEERQRRKFQPPPQPQVRKKVVTDCKEKNVLHFFFLLSLLIFVGEKVKLNLFL